MRWVRTLALLTWLTIASLAVAGFATFTPRGEPQAAVPEVPVTAAVVTTGGDAAGRVAALAFTNGLLGGRVELEGARLPTYAPAYESLGPDGATTTTTRPPPPPRPRPASAAVQPAAGEMNNSFGPCTASWYGEYFRGRPTASGEIYNPDDYTAAHKTLPLGTVVTVTRVDTGASVTVRVNDRGPYVGDRCIDLSRASMDAIGGVHRGLVTVVVNY